MKGSAIVVQTLIDLKVDTVFGYPGGYIIDVFDDLYKQKDKIKQVLTCHEQGACHAADGYARATGKVGVVCSTSGPGATNLVTGIATAYMDSIPLVAITGNVTLSNLGRDSFQEVDITGVTMPVTKHNYIVKDIAALQSTIIDAFRVAKSGRPGPVLVDIPKNIQQSEFEYNKELSISNCELKEPTTYNLDDAVNLINNAERPLLYVGGGVISSGASDVLTAFAHKIKAPVSCSLMGLGAFSANEKQHLGFIGMHGHVSVAKAMQQCDLFIAIGARFSDRVAGNRDNFLKHAKILHMDIDAAEINKNVRITNSICGDVKNVLTSLLPLVKANQKADEWLKKCDDFKKHNNIKKSGYTPNPHDILRSISKHDNGNLMIATDVGQHQMWTAQTYPFLRPRQFLTSGGLGTMGFGLGASIGAAMGKCGRVALITGDGSFHMNLNELVTASKLGLKIAVFVFNNSTLGMVRQWQKLFYNARFSSTDLHLPTNYLKLAEAFNILGLTIEKDSDIDSVVTKALTHNGTVLVECKLHNDELVLPMIPPGKSVDDLITEIEEKL